MRQLKKATVVFLLIAGIVLIFYRPVFMGERLAYISLPLGSVHVQKPNSAEWVKAALNMPLFEGDRVRTLEKSRCEITFADKKVMRIDENALVELVRGDAQNNVSASAGKLWIRFITQGSGSGAFKVRTPTSVCAIRGTVYHLDCDSIHTRYRVYDGNIEIHPAKNEALTDKSFSIARGEEMILVSNFEEYKKEQEKKFKEYMDRDREKTEEYMRREQDAENRFINQDQEKFQKFAQEGDPWKELQKELAAFQSCGSFHYHIQKFDFKNEAQNDWIQWNLQRDGSE